MDLESELNKLSTSIAKFHQPPKISEAQWQEFCNHSTVALMAGGESSRFAAVLEGQTVNKNAHELPNGDTMIEMAIRMFRDAGIKNFAALVFHNAHSVEDRLGDGSSLGVNIKYSYDPEKQVGKGGAIRNAIENGTLKVDRHLIVVNPDDVILNFPGSFPRFIAEAHLEGEAKGKSATAVLAPGIAYPATGMAVQDNEVVDTFMYPFIPVPAHIGVSVFSPKLLPRFKELFSLTQKTDFEQVLFPLLVDEGKLWSAGFTEGEWIAVNDLKSYKQLVDALQRKSEFNI